MTEPTKRGGARPGAGRKPSASPKARFNVMLDVELAGKLRAMGKGNLSYGIQRTYELAKQLTIAELNAFYLTQDKSR